MVFGRLLSLWDLRQRLPHADALQVASRDRGYGHGRRHRRPGCAGWVVHGRDRDLRGPSVLRRSANHPGSGRNADETRMRLGRVVARSVPQPNDSGARAAPRNRPPRPSRLQEVAVGAAHKVSEVG
jgi:hypothetical protein